MMFFWASALNQIVMLRKLILRVIFGIPISILSEQLTIYKIDFNESLSVSDWKFLHKSFNACLFFGISVHRSVDTHHLRNVRAVSHVF